MLIDQSGNLFDPRKLPKGRKAREAVLATLTEVPKGFHGHAHMFNVQRRFKLREDVCNKPKR